MNVKCVPDVRMRLSFLMRLPAGEAEWATKDTQIIEFQLNKREPQDFEQTHASLPPESGFECCDVTLHLQQKLPNHFQGVFKRGYCS